MHRWIASAAGGTSQRLKPGPATMRSFDSMPAWAMCAAVAAPFKLLIGLPSQRIGFFMG
ncbi:hypothetical protein WDV90_12025 [Xanthomonas translucens pv. undulosa]